MSTTRRSFIRSLGLASAGAVATGGALKQAVAQTSLDEEIYGRQGNATTTRPKGVWQPVSDRKIRVGIVGGGFGLAFEFDKHPNVTVAGVSDLIPERCRKMVKTFRCDTTFPSLEEMVKDKTIEAIFVATDAPSHARHCIDVLKHGKYVASCVPAVWGSIDDAYKLLETVKSCGVEKYMMFETSAFHEDCYAMQQIYRAGGFGELIYSEGEYYHHMPKPLGSFHGWRVGLPPQWYPTHSNAYYVCVTRKPFTEVSCMGMPCLIPHLQPANNRYKNPFGTEIALLRTKEGGMARMVVSWDTWPSGAEAGRVRGQRGSVWNRPFEGHGVKLPKLDRPPLPPHVDPGGHGGSHGNLVEEFIRSILEVRRPLVDITMALNLTVAGIVADQSRSRTANC